MISSSAMGRKTGSLFSSITKKKSLLEEVGEVFDPSYFFSKARSNLYRFLCLPILKAHACFIFSLNKIKKIYNKYRRTQLKIQNYNAYILDLNKPEICDPKDKLRILELLRIYLDCFEHRKSLP